MTDAAPLRPRGKSASRDHMTASGFSGQLKVFAGNSNPSLGLEIARHLGVGLGSVTLDRFRDGEIRVQVLDNVRGADVFVVQSTCPPVNEHLMELLLLVDALKRASAARINAVIPYYGYGRQDRKDRSRVPISAKLVADLLTVAGVDRVISMDLHAGQIQGYFNIPVDHLYATPVMLDCIRSLGLERPIIVSPDAGGVERARVYGKKLGVGIAVMDKRRGIDGEVETIHVVGEVRDRAAVLVDDMVDSAGTLVRAAGALRSAGATRVLAVCTHAVLSPPAPERIAGGPIEMVIVGDTIPVRDEGLRTGKIHVVSLAQLLATAIESVHGETSVSRLFA